MTWRRFLVLVLGGAVTAMVTVVVAERLGVAPHDLKVFAAGEMAGATAMFVGVLAIGARGRR